VRRVVHHGEPVLGGDRLKSGHVAGVAGVVNRDDRPQPAAALLVHPRVAPPDVLPLDQRLAAAGSRLSAPDPRPQSGCGTKVTTTRRWP
jgi:hypothetical protein